MEKQILLDAGSGGRASQRLINNLFLHYFNNEILAVMDDAALLPPIKGNLAMSTDSYTVTPLFFPGGSIGSIAIHGTVNDLAMLGAKPLWLACSFIIEEGLAFAVLEQIVSDMARACSEANVKIVTGDTKVVPKGMCDKIFINTSGIGELLSLSAPSGHNAVAGDVVIVSGNMGDHGLTIMAAREELALENAPGSDSAPLADIVESLIKNRIPVHVLRDPTRGGLATTLNEIAEQSNVCIEIEENEVPINPVVKDSCSFLGLDPLYLANEGKLVCIVPAQWQHEALKLIQSHKYGQNAAIIGKVTAKHPGQVILNTRIGGQRFLGMLEGAQLPRIC